jgi:DNA-binding NtrC family response regulator
MPRERALIGVVEDDPVMGGTLVHRLELEGYNAIWWRTGQEALNGLRAARPDLVVCDIRLPDISGEQVFFSVLSHLGGMPFLFVTAYGQVEQAVRLTKAGAVDYIAKPYALPDLLDRIPRLISQRPGAAGVLGTSQTMRQLELLLRRVADIDSSLLFTGESGAGKEVAARFVHEISARATAPFMAVNCAAIPHELIESELFGHEKGAFTGAHARHHGYVERARDGFLFLDEVGELPMPVQAKLLRLLEERAFTRIGGEAAIKASARIVCATNVDLERAVSEGRFRRDLYYRINVIPINVPALRYRPDDVLPLAQTFVREFSRTFGREVHGFTAAAEQALLSQRWPGNVRELRNHIERAVALAPSGWIGPEALFPDEGAIPVALENMLPTLFEARAAAERRHIRTALELSGGRIEEAAKTLGISRSTLFDKMKKLEVRSEAERPKSLTASNP